MNIKQLAYVKNVLIQVQEEGWTGFVPRDFPRAKPEGNPEEQPCQPKENLLYPNFFTWIYILFEIGHFGDFSEFFKY